MPGRKRQQQPTRRLTTTTPPPSDLDKDAAKWWGVFVELLEEAGKLEDANPVLVQTAAQIARIVDDCYQTTLEKGVSYKVDNEKSGTTRHYRRPEAEAFASFNKQLRETIHQLGLDDLTQTTGDKTNSEEAQGEGGESDPLSVLRRRLGTLADGVRSN